MTTTGITNSENKTPRLLGAAFLLQALASAIAGLVLLPNLIVPGSIVDSMTNIANHTFQMRAAIVLQMITAIGIVMLGILLYETLKSQNRKIAFVAMGLYVMEATILAASRAALLSLIHISQESVIAGHPANLQTLGKLLYDFADSGDWLHMLVFGLGATLFYFLFFKSGYLPKALALFGLIAAPLALLGTLFLLLGIEVPMIVFLPNLPFEVGIGVWLIVKGIRDGSETG
jgi:hypothetical protein